MKLLDLFCGAGGCSRGYFKAGFTDIVGVDNKRKKHYPYYFFQGDALQFLQCHWREFDFIHASPPCQRWSKAGKGCVVTLDKNYPDYITPLKEILATIPLPYVIENVPFAPIRPDVKLWGTMFNLHVRRERWFEVGNGLWIMQPGRGYTQKRVKNGGLITVAGSGSTHNRKREGNKIVYGPKATFWQGSVKKTWAYAMGIDHNTMTRDDLAQAIPPAYTEWIGSQIFHQVKKITNARNNTLVSN